MKSPALGTCPLWVIGGSDLEREQSQLFAPNQTAANKEAVPALRLGQSLCRMSNDRIEIAYERPRGELGPERVPSLGS